MMGVFEIHPGKESMGSIQLVSMLENSMCKYEKHRKVSKESSQAIIQFQELVETVRQYELPEERMKSHGSKQNDGNDGKYPKRREKENHYKIQRTRFGRGTNFEEVKFQLYNKILQTKAKQDHCLIL